MGESPVYLTDPSIIWPITVSLKQPYLSASSYEVRLLLARKPPPGLVVPLFEHIAASIRDHDDGLVERRRQENTEGMRHVVVAVHVDCVLRHTQELSEVGDGEELVCCIEEGLAP